MNEVFQNALAQFIGPALLALLGGYFFLHLKVERLSGKVDAVTDKFNAIKNELDEIKSLLYKMKDEMIREGKTLR
jgi:uncharacterized protein YaaN involved in tellurite resistance